MVASLQASAHTHAWLNMRRKRLVRHMQGTASAGENRESVRYRQSEAQVVNWRSGQIIEHHQVSFTRADNFAVRDL
jgi:hypothetical protein